MSRRHRPLGYQFLKQQWKAIAEDEKVPTKLRLEALDRLARLDGLVLGHGLGRPKKKVEATRAGVEGDPEALALLERVEKANGRDWAGG